LAIKRSFESRERTNDVYSLSAFTFAIDKVLEGAVMKYTEYIVLDIIIHGLGLGVGVVGLW
jgi:hypothetical protein